MAPRPRKRRRRSTPSARSFVAFVVSTVGIALGGLYLLGRTPRLPVCDALTDAGSAAPTVTVYMDFQCPECASVDRNLHAISQRWKLPYVVRHYPLDRDCNVRAPESLHPGACLQASAAICADGLSAGGGFRERLFRSKARDVPALMDLAVEVGIDSLQFERCLSSAETAELLRRHIEAAAEQNVDSLPTLFVNETRHVGRLREHDLRCIVALDRRSSVS